VDAGLIARAEDGQLIQLNPGVGTDRVIRHLVQSDMPVFEVTPVEQTLESFYLSLMNEKRS
jgi:hypothetical protein